MRNDYRVIIPILFSITESGAFREAKNGIILTKCDKKTTGGKARRFGVVFMFFRLFRPEENKQNSAGYFE